MKLTAWRIVKRKHVRSAFTGEGERRFGGRWNSPGTPLIYTAQSQALAALEMLVNLDSAEILKHYVALAASFDEALAKWLDPATLPAGWRRYPAPRRLQQIGDMWAASVESAVMVVPSAVVASENNFLINPKHPDFGEVAIGKPAPFRFDPRMAR